MNRAKRELQLYQAPPHRCGYLEGRMASSVFVDPEAALDPQSYDALLALGFRRSGAHVYRPACPDCEACVPARVRVNDFSPRRSQRRTWRANQDLTMRVRPAAFDPEHYALYLEYTARRHGEGEMANMTAAEYRDFLISDWCETDFLEFRWNDRLMAVAVTDRGPTGLSALYTFYDPEAGHRSLGVFAILSQIERARQLGLPYLYLGYWIRECRKMAYKTEYRPLELLRDGRWQPLANAA